MSIATEILSLRRDQSSSVATLIAAMEWESAAEDDVHMVSRGYAVMQAVDIVLLNVAVHTADALAEPTTIRRTRRAVSSSRRNRRRSDAPELRQRAMFA